MDGVDANELTSPITQLAEDLLALAPRAGLALICLILGLVLAYILARVTRWAVRRVGLDALGERAGASRVLYGVGFKKGLPEALGKLVWIAVFLLTLAVVAETAGLPGVAEGIGALTEFIPRLVAAGMIVLGGVVAADLLRGLVRRVAQRRGDVDDPGLAGSVVYYLILIVTFTLAAEQLGFATDLVNKLILITVAAVLFSLGLSFALGSREAFRSMIGRYYAENRFRPGDRIRLADAEGVVVRYSSVYVVVQTDGGKLVLPCRRLLEESVRLDELPEDGDIEERDPDPDADSDRVTGED